LVIVQRREVLSRSTTQCGFVLNYDEINVDKLTGRVFGPVVPIAGIISFWVLKFLGKYD
jgi:hypothetical protein